MRLLIVVSTALLCASAHAETTAATGQPLCTTMDGLHAYLNAMIMKDRKALGAVSGCAMVKGGLPMEVIDRGDATSGMHIDKVRVVGANGSGVGYTMNFDP